jgi:hypothetical protein
VPWTGRTCAGTPVPGLASPGPVIGPWIGIQARCGARPGGPVAAGVGAGRHVWVRAEDGVWLPGLLTQWRRGPAAGDDLHGNGPRGGGGDGDRGGGGGGGWSALVVYAIDAGGQPVLVQAWIPADRLRPADR